MNWLYNRALVGALLVCVGLTGCSDDTEEAAPEAQSKAAAAASGGGGQSPLLAYIPDDTPYFLANESEISDDLVDLIWEMAEPGLGYAEAAIAAKLAEGTDDPAEQAVLEELSGKLNREGLSELGLDPGGNMAIYGLGVLPVLRAEITDSSALKATISRIEEKSGKAIPKVNRGGIEYYELGDAEGTIIVSVNDNQVVMGVTPTIAKDTVLDQILGIEKPARSVADSGRISDLNKEFGLLPVATLFVDPPALVDAVLSDDSEAAQMMFSEERAKMTPACVAEIRGMAEIMPRMVSGYTALDRSRMDQVAHAELRSDIAQSLQGLMIPMAGMGQEAGGLFNFALAFDLLKTKQFLIDRAAAVSAEPYQCAELADINTGMAELQTKLSQPLPPMVGNIQGLRINIKEAEMAAGGMPTNLRALVMVGMTNPQLIVGMASAFVPQMATLQMDTNGTPVPVPPNVIPFPLDEPHVAMMNHGLAFSVGVGEQDNLKSFLDAELPDEPSFITMGYDAAAMQMYQQQMMQTMAAMSGEAGMPDMPAPADLLDRVHATISFSDKGVDIVSTSTLKP
ncbi:MAG: hypothetical protein QNJ40_22995 [Xanthomonadales bacterium]|nr:hypothetical protein [Xanthomonadales bacterium]